MKIVADENIDAPIVDRLRKEGHRVWYVAEMSAGISDDLVLDLANQESSLLLTADKDFGELVFRQGKIASGIILIRLAGLSSVQKANLVASVINQRLTELAKAFTVISPKSIRIRQLK